MSLELEIAPPIEVVETTDDDLDIPDMEAHLYMPSEFKTLCGIKSEDDPHESLHCREKLPNWFWHRGDTTCGCGAPICQKCNSLAIQLGFK